MQRYSGEDFDGFPHIVVLGSCKVGNFVVSIPVLTGLRKRFPNATIGFIGSEVTADFERELPVINWRCSWDAPLLNSGLNLQLFISSQKNLYGEVDLAINLDSYNAVTCILASWLNPQFVAGGSFSANLRSYIPWGTQPRQSFLSDFDWDSLEFLERYRQLFTSNYIADLFCEIAYVSDYVDSSLIELPSCAPLFNTPDLLIHCTTSRSAKVWPFIYWKEVIDVVSEWGWSIGLVGSPPALQNSDYNSAGGEQELLCSTSLIDLRGKTSLIQLAGACKLARAVVSVDAGPLHISAAVGTPTLAVVGNDSGQVGASPIRLWLPRSSNCERTVADYTCTLCADNHFKNDDCLIDGHPCLTSVKPAMVIDWLKHICSEFF